MKLTIDRPLRILLLQALRDGVLDTEKIPQLYKDMRGKVSLFEELLIETGIIEEQEPEKVIES